MEEKKSHTKNERSLPDHEEQELWFSALVADDSCAYNVDKAFDRFVSRTQQKRRTVFNIPKIVYGAAAVILLLIASTISYWWGERQLQNQFADILVEAPLGAKTNTDLPALVAGKRNSPFAFVDVPVVVPFSKIVTPGNGFPSVSMTSPS